MWCRAAPGTCSGQSNGNVKSKSLQGCCVGGAGWRGTAKTASMRALFRAIHGALHPRRPTPPHLRQVHGGLGSADPWSAECFRQRPAALADHGSALPLFFFSYAGGGHRNLSGGRAVGLGGGVERHGWRETRPAGCGFCRPPHSPTARPKPRLLLKATREGVQPVRPSLSATPIDHPTTRPAPPQRNHHCCAAAPRTCGTPGGCACAARRHSTAWSGSGRSPRG